MKYYCLNCRWSGINPVESKGKKICPRCSQIVSSMTYEMQSLKDYKFISRARKDTQRRIF